PAPQTAMGREQLQGGNEQPRPLGRPVGSPSPGRGPRSFVGEASQHPPATVVLDLTDGEQLSAGCYPRAWAWPGSLDVFGGDRPAVTGMTGALVAESRDGQRALRDLDEREKAVAERLGARIEGHGLVDSEAAGPGSSERGEVPNRAQVRSQ